MQDHAADHLHIEVTHADNAAAALAHDSKGLRQQVVENALLRGRNRVFTVILHGGDGFRYPRLECGSLASQFVIRKRLQRGLESSNFIDNGKQPLHDALVAGAENLG